MSEAPQADPVPLADPTDDLTRINGIGPKLERLLNDLGIRSYAQIAAFSDEDIETLDAQLGRFSGRIQRDNWIAQASDLAGLSVIQDG
jgi:predicted flap endonuclease-1-like 5' DNA nuclease